MGTQKKSIKEHLLNGKPITAISALNLYGCFRLSSIINTLRNEGVAIVDTWVSSKKVGKHFKSYYVEKELV